jgi:hypothetical protein
MLIIYLRSTGKFPDNKCIFFMKNGVELFWYRQTNRALLAAAVQKGAL